MDIGLLLEGAITKYFITCFFLTMIVFFGLFYQRQLRKGVEVLGLIIVLTVLSAFAMAFGSQVILAVIGNIIKYVIARS